MIKPYPLPLKSLVSPIYAGILIKEASVVEKAGRRWRFVVRSELLHEFSYEDMNCRESKAKKYGRLTTNFVSTLKKMNAVMTVSPAFFSETDTRTQAEMRKELLILIERTKKVQTEIKSQADRWKAKKGCVNWFKHLLFDRSVEKAVKTVDQTLTNKITEAENALKKC